MVGWWMVVVLAAALASGSEPTPAPAVHTRALMYCSGHMTHRRLYSSILWFSSSTTRLLGEDATWTIRAPASCSSPGQA